VPTSPDTVVQIEVNDFELRQIISSPVSDPLAQFGSDVDIRNNQILVSAPGVSGPAAGEFVLRKGEIFLYILDSQLTNTKIVTPNVSALSPGQNILVNDWLFKMPDSTVTSFVTGINNLTVYTGISASYNGTSNQLSLIFNQAGIGTTGISTNILITGTNTIDSQFMLVDSVGIQDDLTNNLGLDIKWLSNDLFGTTANYTNTYTSSQLDVFVDNTIFDSGDLKIFDGATVPTQRLVIYQLLETNRNWINQNNDILQLTLVQNINVTGVQTSGVAFAGDINNIWLGSSAVTAGLDQYFNQNLTHGWTLISQQQTSLEPRTISAAWLYNPVTNTKLVDLDVVDLTTGLLPGGIAQELDYVCDADPAIYGYPLWKAGQFYQINDIVLYGNQLQKSKVQGASGAIFNQAFWQVITPDSPLANSGYKKWGSNQVGQTWFNTTKLKVIDSQFGNISQRANDWNSWFPNSEISVFEWVNSTLPPAQFVNSDENGFVPNINCPYTFDPLTKLYGFWVTNKSSLGAIHNISVNNLITSLMNVPGNGISMVTPIDFNAIALWNINQYISSQDAILHIDYVIKDANNNLHTEFVLMSNDGSKTWFNTPIYPKFIDSLSGQTTTGLLVPDPSIAPSQQYGTSNSPEQSIFVDRVSALLVYYQSINASLANVAVATPEVVASITGSSPIPTSGFSMSVPNRNILNSLDITQFPENYRILIVSDNEVANSGWSIVSNQNNQWQFAAVQIYDLTVMWEYMDWSATPGVIITPTYTINNIGEIYSLDLVAGNTIKVLNNGNGEYAIYQYEPNATGQLIQELVPIYIQNGTIQFLPALYDFSTANIGFDLTGFDTVGFDNDPYNEIRIITESLNDIILVGSLSNIADAAFFGILNYIIHENQNLDWLFRTSFVSAQYPIENLNVLGDYRSDNPTLMQDFITETVPYHTRIREFIDVYDSSDQANIAISDFDLPAQWDNWYYQLAQGITFTSNIILQTEQFLPNTVTTVDFDNFYIKSDGLPANSLAGEEPQNWVFEITRYVNNDSTVFATAPNDAGPEAVAIDGVPFYNANSGITETLYLTSNLAVSATYTINSVYEYIQQSLDPTIGIVTPTGVVEYLTDPRLLYTKNSSEHSPILGFAFDGCPIYGPYGFANSDGSGGVILNTSSWQLSATQRLDKTGQPIVNGLQLAQFATPTGQYIEDYQYVYKSGTLDEHNGRYCVTPEYPNGVYAYFIAVNPNTFVPVYPYVIGSTYYGIPTGLVYRYVNGVNTPTYPNGNVVFPAPFNISDINFVRSPDGTISTDPTTLTMGVYNNWNENYTYSIGNISIINPGLNYDANTVVSVNSVNGQGGGVIAVATVNPSNGSILTITVIDPGAGFTLTPDVVVSSGNATVQCTAYAQLVNSLTRKIDATVRYDRVGYTLSYFNANVQYGNGSVVFDNVSGQFYTSIVSNPSSNIANANSWIVSSNLAISTSTALNRIYELYQPNANLFANDPKLLMSGLEYPGVFVTNANFVNMYPTPTGPLNNIQDKFLGQSSLNVSWDPGLLSDSAFSTQVFKFGQSSGSFDRGFDRYITIDGSQSSDQNQLALGTAEFTIEFFCRFSTLETTNANGNVVMTDMILLDTRTETGNVLSNNGLVIYKTANNQIALTQGNLAAPIVVGGGVATNVWQFVTVQRSNTLFTLYVDGNLVDLTMLSNIANPNFTDVGLTFGAAVDGSNVTNGFLDEVRITSNVLRYPVNSTTIPVPTQAFPRTLQLDPYLDAAHTKILYGFEKLNNEAPLDIVFETVNSETILLDQSWNAKDLVLFNYAENQIQVDSSTFGNTSGSGAILAVTLNI
jgi:hypothetical protein